MSLINEQERIDAQSKCVPCKLCGGAAKITDAGVGWGYYIACENANNRKITCLCGEVRRSGHAYNVQKLWNRLHGENPSPSPKRTGEDQALIERLRNLVDNQTGGDAVVLVQRQLFNKVVGRLSALSRASREAK